MRSVGTCDSGETNSLRGRSSKGEGGGRALTPEPPSRPTHQHMRVCPAGRHVAGQNDSVNSKRVTEFRFYV